MAGNGRLWLKVVLNAAYNQKCLYLKKDGYLMMMMKMIMMMGKNQMGSPIHNCFGPPFLSVGGLLSPGATLSGDYLFVELGYYYILFQHKFAKKLHQHLIKRNQHTHLI